MSCNESQYSEHFNAALKHTLGVEGEFSDHPDDSGGATRWGIIERVARANGYNGSMRNLPIEKAKEIYHKDYWSPLNLDDVAELSPEVAAEVFDSAVNTGTRRAWEWMQRLLNVLNRQGRDYGDIVEDGASGPASLGALRAYYRKRGRAGMGVLLKGLNALQGAFYVGLAERRPKDQSFLYGWLRTRL